MFNKTQLIKSPCYKNQNIEVLPNFNKANLFLSSQNINGSLNSSKNSTDDNDNFSIESEKLINSKKSKSTSNIFDRIISEKYLGINPDNIKPSLKLCVESMVYGQKLQMTCELLLLSSSTELWPISLHHLNKVNRDFHRFFDCHDEMLISINMLKHDIDQFENVVIGDESASICPDVKIAHISDIVSTSITIMELTYQLVYIISTTQPSWKKNQPGLLDRKTIISAIDDVELSCFRLREVLLRTSNTDTFDSSNQELQDVMLLSCSHFSSALTYLAICCRTAAANVEISIKSIQRSSKKSSDTRAEENLFQLAMRSVSKSSQCMLASVKNYVHEPSPENRFITESFTNSVSSAVKSLAAMATSSKFIGYPSLLPLSIKMTRNTICGSCMSLISPTVQLLQTTAAIYFVGINPPKIFDPTTGSSDSYMSHLSQRAITCLAAMRDALSHLQQTLVLYKNY